MAVTCPRGSPRTAPTASICSTAVSATMTPAPRRPSGPPTTASPSMWTTAGPRRAAAHVRRLPRSRLPDQGAGLRRGAGDAGAGLGELIGAVAVAATDGTARGCRPPPRASRAFPWITRDSVPSVVSANEPLPHSTPLSIFISRTRSGLTKGRQGWTMPPGKRRKGRGRSHEWQPIMGGILGSWDPSASQAL